MSEYEKFKERIANRPPNPYAAKFTEEQRCVIYWLMREYNAKVSISNWVTMTGLKHARVSMIRNPANPAWGPTKEKYNKHGHAEFFTLFVEPHAEYMDEIVAKFPFGPNKNADGRSNRMYEHIGRRGEPHHFAVAWFDVGDETYYKMSKHRFNFADQVDSYGDQPAESVPAVEEGWYYRTKDMEYWAIDEHNKMSSEAAYQHVLRAIRKIYGWK